MTEQTMVYLKKPYIVALTGNRYPRGNYALESLPVAIRDNKDYVQHLNTVKAVVEKEKERQLNTTQEPVKKLEKVQYITELDAPINVNDASIEDLVAINGIGRKTANTIIQNRPYKDLTDLRIRAKLRLDVEDINWRVGPPAIKTDVSAMKVVKKKLDIPNNTDAERRKKRSEVLEERKTEKKKLLIDFADKLKTEE